MVAAGAGGGEGTPGKEKSSRAEKMRVQRETDKHLKTGTLVWIHSPHVGNSNVAFKVVGQIFTEYKVSSLVVIDWLWTETNLRAVHRTTWVRLFVSLITGRNFT